MKHLMNRMAMTVRLKFDSAHRLTCYDGKCWSIHGHTYHLEATVSRDNPREMMSLATDMVADFSDVKAIIKKHVIDLYDHAYIWIGEDAIARAALHEGMKTVLLKTDGAGQTTAESMIIDIANRLTNPFAKARLRMDRIKLWETENSFIEIWNDEAC